MPFVRELATINRRQNSRGSDRRESAPFKVLNGSFVFLGRSFCFERAQVPWLSRPRVLLSRIQTIAARAKFSDHINSSSFGRAVRTRSLFSNGALLAACGLNETQIRVLNSFSEKIGWRDAAAAVVERVKKQAGHADIATIFDCIDASEGRLALART
jgi:hypothetical protein